MFFPDMRKLTPAKTPADTDASTALVLLERYDAVLQRIAAVESLLKSLNANTCSTVLERLAATEARIATLNLAEQSQAFNALMREQFATLEWLTRAMRSARDLIGDLREESDDASQADSVNDAIPSLGTALSGLVSSGKAAKGGLPPELGALLGKLGVQLG